MGFTGVLRDFDKYSDDEAHALGINDSTLHVDFMIGSADLSIKGIDKNGNEIEIFKNGEWAF
jgi:aminopeptidase